MNNLFVNFLIGSMLMTAVWAVVSWICVRIIQLQSPVARFLVFLIPLIAAFVARVRLSAGMTMEVIVFCFFAAGLLLMKDLYFYHRFRRRMEAEATPSEELQLLVDDLAGSFGMPPPRALVSNGPLVSPLTAGLRTPFLVIPQQIIPHLSGEELRLLLAHEMAHIRRRDIFWKWLLLFLRRLSFLNPVADWPYRWLSLETERAADRLAIAVTRKPGSFARMLLKVEELLAPIAAPHKETLPVVVSRASSYLPARIEELASPPISSGVWVTLLKVGAIFAVYKLLCFKPVEIWQQFLP